MGLNLKENVYSINKKVNFFLKKHNLITYTLIFDSFLNWSFKTSWKYILDEFKHYLREQIKKSQSGSIGLSLSLPPSPPPSVFNEK